MKKLLPWIAAILLVLLVGCVPPGPPPDPVAESGSLVLTFVESEVRTFLPAVDMTIAAYDVQGTGPGGATFQQLGVIGPTLAVNALVTGAWSVTVDAKNAAGGLIATGSVGATIAAGQTTAASVTVSPLSGTGTLNVNIYWLTGLIASPSVTATLAPQGGVPAAFTLTLAADGLSATRSNAVVSAGYHTLSITILDGTQVVYGMTDVVRIIAGSATDANIVLTAAQITRAAGGLNLSVTPDLRAPVTIAFSANGSPYVGGQQVQISRFTNITATATPSAPVDTYQWYLNGAALSGQTLSSTTVGSSLLPGNYRLDVVVAKLNVMSAGHVDFKVLVPGAVNLAWKPSLGPYLVDGNGMTLYYTDSDGANWSVVDLPTSDYTVFYAPIITVTPPVDPAKLRTWVRDTGESQTTYGVDPLGGRPLYHFVLDLVPGDTLGNNPAYIWHVINPATFPY